MALKKFMINIMEEKLNLKKKELDHTEASQEEESAQVGLFNMFKMASKKHKKCDSEIKVADISFAYENHKLIKKMKGRGGYIASQKWEKLEKKEDSIKNTI